MFLRIVKDSFARQARRKLLTAVALALGTAVATATVSVALDVGDRLGREFRSLGANLLVTPQADTLPLEIGGVDYRPVDAGAYLQDANLGKLKTIFWRNNIIGFAPFLDVPVALLPVDASVRALLPPGASASAATAESSNASPVISPTANRPAGRATLIGTWYSHGVQVPNGGGIFRTGLSATDPWWHVSGSWFADGAAECVVGASLARRAGIGIGQTLEVQAGGLTVPLRVTGIVTTGGQEDDAIVAPLEIAQRLSDHPGQYRRLLVSALTKPEDAFSQRDPSAMTPADYDRWYCSPYISSISRQMQEQFPAVEVRPIRQIAEGEGRILTRVSALMWVVTLAALLAAALAVAATAGTTVLERKSEIGLMKALGASRLLIGAFFLGEQWLLALLGGAAGYAAGIGLAHLLGQQVFGVSPQWRPILLPVVLGMAAAVATLGSLVPLRGMVQLDPAPVLRGE
jgi:putative ABC transport system permease protein